MRLQIHPTRCDAAGYPDPVTANRLDPSTPPGGGPGLPPLPESWLPREHALHRPRHGVRQTSSRVAALVFFCVPLLLLVVGVRAPEFENRRLADFPSVTDGFGLFTGLDQWATDHLPLRDKAVQAEDGISRGVFGEPPQFLLRGRGHHATAGDDQRALCRTQQPRGDLERGQ